MATQGDSTTWRIPDLLASKSESKVLTENQIKYLIRCVSDRSMDDCQLGAFLMAVKLCGMIESEVVALTKAMCTSGRVMSWPDEWRVVDKHSTGGVGDKISLVLAPALASHGLKVPMISGRGLAHTGGTLDKLESIPGYRVDLDAAELYAALEKVGCCIVGQTPDIVPADRRMYAARDVTSTVKSLPLIVSSIISKKAAESVSSLVLDVKVGRGAFMATQEEAERLARTLVDVANGVGMHTTALLTSMDAPIGRTIGNALEVREAIDCLRGEGPKDLQELVTYLGGELMAHAGLSATVEAGRTSIDEALKDGSARMVFCRMLQAQGVSRQVAEDLCGSQPDYRHLPSATNITPVTATASGVVTAMDAMALARVSLKLGAGRDNVGDPIQHSVGIVLLKVLGEQVREGEAWAELHHDTPMPGNLMDATRAAITIGQTAPTSASSRIMARVA